MKVIEYQDTLGKDLPREGQDFSKCSRGYKVISGKRVLGSGHQLQYFVQVINPTAKPIQICLSQQGSASSTLVSWKFKNASEEFIQADAASVSNSTGDFVRVVSLEPYTALEFSTAIRLGHVPASLEKQVHSAHWELTLGDALERGEIK